MRTWWLPLVLATALPSGAVRADDPIRVTVVVVYASTTNTEIDPKLKALAEEVRKREPKLTGFKLAATLQKSIAVGESHTFELPEKQKLKVTVKQAADDENKVGLTIKPPGVGEVTYTCSCSKFFPVVTPQKTAAGEQLIVAVMAKPCTGKGP